MTTTRWILHADMDAFYASVEQRDDPSLKGKPVIVGATSPRGVVSAASYEARKFGVRSAMPGFEAKKRCPDGVFLPGDMKKYAAVSRQIHRMFLDFTDQIEPLALDEAFLDISGSIALFGSPRKIGEQLKQRVLAELGLVVSVGIAPNKLVAKIACTQGKPNGLLIVGKEEVRDLLDPLPVRALFGVGPKAEARLKNLHIHTFRQLVSAPPSLLREAFGSHGEAMRDRARGIDARPVESARVSKSIGEEATFSDNVADNQRILSAITAHSEKVATRARRSGLKGETVVLKVKLARRKAWGEKLVSNHELFPVLTRQMKLKMACSSGDEIRAAAVSLFDQLKLQEPIRLVGVTLTDLQSEHDPRQMDLFAARPRGIDVDETKTKSEALGRVLDAICDKFGEGSVGRAVSHIEKITQGDKIKSGETLQSFGPDAPAPDASERDPGVAFE